VAKIRRHIRRGRLAGIRDFTLKVAMADDAARMGVVRDVLGRSLARGKVTLRVDANGAWDLDAAVAWLKRCADVKLVGVEQPFTREADEDLVPLREQTGVRLIHDESLVTMFDAERLAELGVADAFNVRLSKCGGMLPALRLAEFARGRRIEVQLGCMVGETSILSAAGVRFLEAVPGIRFAEGCFGPLLLQEDVAARSVRFGLAGRPPRLGKSGWGITVEEDRLRRLCVDRPVVMAL
jgi:muconate cycloisomerase